MDARRGVLAALLLGMLGWSPAHADPVDFATVWTAMSSPRCGNCHAPGRGPTIGDKHDPHPFSVRRGTQGRGVAGNRCDGCHEAENSPGKDTPPGAPNWRMPRASFRIPFFGRKRRDVCRQLAPRAARVTKLLGTDPLHAWPWSPGGTRSVPGVSRDELLFALTKWRDAGAPCP